MELVHGRLDDIDLGREMMQHRAPRQARSLGDPRGRGARVAQVDKTLDRSFDDRLTGRGALLRLPAGRLC